MTAELVTTTLIGAIGWIIKEVLFRGFDASRAAARSEWERQLREVWSPIYVNLILLFESDGGASASGYVARVEGILERNVNLIPREHLGRIGRVLSYFKGHSSPKFAKEDVFALTDYCYKRVEELNFILYKDEPAYRIDGRLHPLVWYFIVFRYLIRALWHFTVWAILALLVLLLLGSPVEVPDRFIGTAGAAFLVALLFDFGRLRLAAMEVYTKVRARLSM